MIFQKKALPPEYEIRRAGDFVHVHAPSGQYLGNALAFDLGKARGIAWEHYHGRGEGSVLERGD